MNTIVIRGAVSADELAAVLAVLHGEQTPDSRSTGIRLWRQRRRCALARDNGRSRVR